MGEEKGSEGGVVENDKKVYMYSAAFIQRVKDIYPSNKTMHDMADASNYFLGRYLDDSTSDKIPVGEILRATTLEELQNKAKAMLKKMELYSEWCNVEMHNAKKATV